MAMAFYEFFDNHTNRGRVFDVDLSTFDDLPVKHLTPAEIEERDSWRKTMQTIYDHYDSETSPLVTTTDLLLQQRVMIPNLASVSVSSRSQLKEARRGRRYAPTISEWDEFHQLAAAYAPEPKILKPKYSDIFQLSMFDSSPLISLSDEKEEEGYMLAVLKKSLMTAGLLGEVATRGGVGKPDAVTLTRQVDMALPSDIGIIVQFKSTHNLPMPMMAAGVVEVYNAAYEAVMNQRNGRTAGWSRVCHPIGQLLGYMIENGRRYGVLSSATRAYFVCIQGDGQAARVRISNAWFVGEPDFLRAWAYIHSLACQQSTPLKPQGLEWKKTSSDQPTPPAKRKRKGLQSDAIDEGEEDQDEQGSEERRDAPTGSATQISGLPEIPFDSIELIEALGYGRNGVVFLATWNGIKIALKQFDVGKDGFESYNNEVSAYLALEPVWGSLVATPLFVSESWSGLIKFLGLQLGRSPLPGDDFLSERTHVLNTLENNFGFRHEDAGQGNMVFVMDEQTKTERLVAIDLESYTVVTT